MRRFAVAIINEQLGALRCRPAYRATMTINYALSEEDEERINREHSSLVGPHTSVA